MSTTPSTSVPTITVPGDESKALEPLHVQMGNADDDENSEAKRTFATLRNALLAAQWARKTASQPTRRTLDEPDSKRLSSAIGILQNLVQGGKQQSEREDDWVVLPEAVRAAHLDYDNEQADMRDFQGAPWQSPNSTRPQDHISSRLSEAIRILSTIPQWEGASQKTLDDACPDRSQQERESQVIDILARCLSTRTWSEIKKATAPTRFALPSPQEMTQLIQGKGRTTSDYKQKALNYYESMMKCFDLEKDITSRGEQPGSAFSSVPQDTEGRGTGDD